MAQQLHDEVNVTCLEAYEPNWPSDAKLRCSEDTFFQIVHAGVADKHDIRCVPVQNWCPTIPQVNGTVTGPAGSVLAAALVDSHGEVHTLDLFNPSTGHEDFIDDPENYVTTNTTRLEMAYMIQSNNIPSDHRDYEYAYQDHIVKAADVVEVVVHSRKIGGRISLRCRTENGYEPVSGNTEAQCINVVKNNKTTDVHGNQMEGGAWFGPHGPMQQLVCRRVEPVVKEDLKGWIDSHCLTKEPTLVPGTSHLGEEYIFDAGEDVNVPFHQDAHVNAVPTMAKNNAAKEGTVAFWYHLDNLDEFQIILSGDRMPRHQSHLCGQRRPAATTTSTTSTTTEPVNATMDNTTDFFASSFIDLGLNLTNDTDYNYTIYNKFAYDDTFHYHDGYCISPFTIFVYKGMLYVRNFVGLADWHNTYRDPQVYEDRLNKSSHSVQRRNVVDNKDHIWTMLYNAPDEDVMNQYYVDRNGV